jgi:class 3 adenylate cyclase
MLRRKLEPRMGDLRLLRARLVPTWCRSLTVKARVREIRPSRSLPLLSRRRSLKKVRAILCVDLPIIG